MKILDAGTENLTNMDVLNWISAKKSQHAIEDAADKKHNQKFKPRPKRFLQALQKHERELNNADKYPYASNPNVYNGSYDAMERFDQTLMERICGPLEERYKELLPTMSKPEVERLMKEEQEMKCLTDAESLMIFNLAPKGVEQLAPMIEDCEGRYTAEEQQIIIDTVMEVLRADEMKAQGGINDLAKDDMDVEGGAEVDAQPVANENDDVDAKPATYQPSTNIATRPKSQPEIFFMSEHDLDRAAELKARSEKLPGWRSINRPA